MKFLSNMEALKLKAKIKLIRRLCRWFGSVMHMADFPSYSVYTLRNWKWLVSRGDIFTPEEFAFYQKHYPFARKVKKNA